MCKTKPYIVGLSYPIKGINFRKFPKTRKKELNEVRRSKNKARKILSSCKRRRQVSKSIYENSRMSYVYKLDMESTSIKRIPRGGVVFYTFIEDKIRFCFGRDQKNNDIKDLGGGKRKY